jgi:hypothetical protein
MVFCLAAGIGVALYLLWSLLTQPHEAVVRDGHIVYAVKYAHSDALLGVYLGATILPFMLSSQRMMIALGALIGAGAIAAYFLYWEAFVSVWCFFAAAGSVLLLWHFELVRKRRLQTAPA